MVMDTPAPKGEAGRPTFLLAESAAEAREAPAKTPGKTPPPTPPTTPLATRPILAARAVAEYASLTVAPITLRMERDILKKSIAIFAGVPK